MPEREYQVGDFWLARDKEGGPYKINWYDPSRRKNRRQTTGTKCFQEAVKVITAHHLAHLEPEKEDGLTVRQVALKYWQDHAAHLTASETSRVSLDKLNSFLESKEGTGPDMQAEDWTRNTTKEFVAWIRKNPTYYEKKVRDSKGKVVETIRRPRSYTDASINRVLDDVRAAFRFCMDRPPVIQGIQRVVPREGRKKPTLSVQQVKDLFAYAYASEDRKHLQNYLLIAFTTLARPEAIIDISVAAERGQVEWDYRLLHLNPEGRQQTKKHRPSIPINDYLLPVIQECHNEYLVHKADPENTPKHSGFLVQYRGKPIASIRQTWNRAKKALGWPMGGSIGRDWDAKMIRHTMSKWLRAQGAPWPEIEGQMGHRIDSQTAAYAEYEPDYLGRVQAEITRYMSQIFEGQNWACTPLAPHLEKNVVSIKAKKGDKSSG